MPPSSRAGRRLAGLLVALLALPALAVGTLGSPAVAVTMTTAASVTPRDRLVDPFVGTGGRAPWFSGNTTPAAARPFGMVQLGPDTTSDATTGAPSETASGYAATDNLVRGFSATHLSGAGCPAFGDVPLLPVSGGVPADPASATVGLDHAAEQAGPGWYRVSLANGVRTSLAADNRAGLASFTFPTGPRARLLVKASGSLAGTRRARLSFPSRREVAVTTTSGGFCGSQGSYRIHVLIRFDRATTSRGTWGGTPRPDGSVSGPGIGGWVGFATRDRAVVRARIGVSFVDAAGARRNLESGLQTWSYAALRDAGTAAWARELDRVTTTGGTLEDQQILDTALYHVLLNPMTVSDFDGRYPGFDGRVHRVSPGHRQFTALPGWDAYRTQLPLLAWLRPDVASDVVRSLQSAARQAGWLPRWPLVAAYTGIMNGDSAAPMMAAAYAFGARDFSLPEAVSQLTRQADETDGPPGQGWFQPRPGLADYLRLGYVPNTNPERGWPQPHGASATLEYALDDFAVSRLADDAGRSLVAQRLRQRSGWWHSLLDEDRGLLLPRDADGVFPGPDFDPGGCCSGYQEGNALQYSWAVPQDMAGLLTALGPRDEVLGRLTDFHQQLNTGAGNPHAWLGNQPSFATPWAYLWLGRPDLTQEVVTRARQQLWAATPEGLPGNDDLGSLSAWYVWASVGLYPLTPGTANVGVSIPAFDTVTVRPSTGAVTQTSRQGTGARVQDVLVDGVSRSASWLPFGPARRPAKLVVVTTDAAAPAWGTDPEDLPPSYPAP